MRHAFPVACHLCAAVLKDKVQKKTKTKTRRGGSRDIPVSSLVPINSLTTHASCSAQACGKVTQTKAALFDMKRPAQPTKPSHRQEKLFGLMACFSASSMDLVYVNITCGVSRKARTVWTWFGFPISCVIMLRICVITPLQQVFVCIKRDLMAVKIGAVYVLLQTHSSVSSV